MSIDAKIIRRTKKGDWIALTSLGIEILLSRSDKNLFLGAQVYFQGLRKGEHISFPDGRYNVRNTPIQLVGVGVIDDDHINYAERDQYDYWKALTGNFGRTNLRKNTGPRYVDIGTMVDIHSVRSQGINHRWIDDWSASSVQYPEGQLSGSQIDLARRIQNEFFNGPKPALNGRVGTVVLVDSNDMVIIPDEKFHKLSIFGKDLEARHVFSLSSEPRDQFPVGTRVVYGTLFHDGEYHRDKAYKL